MIKCISRTSNLNGFMKRRMETFKQCARRVLVLSSSSIGLMTRGYMSMGSTCLKVAVIGDEAGGSSNVLLHRSARLGCQVLDQVADIVNIGNTLKSHQVGSKTSNVGRSYTNCTSQLLIRILFG